MSQKGSFLAVFVEGVGTKYLHTGRVKTVKHIKVKTSLWVAFMDIRNISNHSPFICKIHDKQVTEYHFDN